MKIYILHCRRPQHRQPASRQTALHAKCFNNNRFVLVAEWECIGNGYVEKSPDAKIFIYLQKSILHIVFGWGWVSVCLSADESAKCIIQRIVNIFLIQKYVNSRWIYKCKPDIYKPIWKSINIQHVPTHFARDNPKYKFQYGMASVTVKCKY